MKLKNIQSVFRIRNISHTNQPPSKYKKIAVGSGFGLCATLLTYLYLNNPQPVLASKISKLPAVEQLITPNLAFEKLKANQYNVDPKTASIVRMDINSISCNDPSEDYHSENQYNSSCIVGIYDGHSGPQCGAVVAQYISSYVARHIHASSSLIKTNKHTRIKTAMTNAFIELDRDIIEGRLQSLPIPWSWNPFSTTLSEYQRILSNLRMACSGACALVAVIEKDDIYVASIGDCRAVIGREIGIDAGIKVYQALELTKDQTGTSPTEYSRLCEEHPGEDNTVIVRGRVLGGLQPTRSFGDARYKWTRETQQVLNPHIYPGGRDRIAVNLKTPPYVTAKPEVTHYARDKADKFLVIACDGLWDDMSSDKSIELVTTLMNQRFNGNYATALIKAALSGFGSGGPIEDFDRIRHHFSIPPPRCRRYRDDMTVNVIFFDGVESIGESLAPVGVDYPGSGPYLQSWIKKLAGIDSSYGKGV